MEQTSPVLARSWRRKRRRLARLNPLPLAILAVGSIAAAAVGCLPQSHVAIDRSAGNRLRPKPVVPGPQGVYLQVLHLERPIGDPLLNRELWLSADEEHLDIATRGLLERHGLRVGIVGDQLPHLLKKHLTADELEQMNGEHMLIQAGSPTRIQTSSTYPTWPMTGIENGPGGRQPEYRSAVGGFRVNPKVTPDGCVDLVITPEIEHGEPTRHFMPEQEAQGPLQWSFQVGRQTRSFEDLSFALRVRPREFVLIGCTEPKHETLGPNLLTRKQGDQTFERMVILLTESSEAAAARPHTPR